MNRRHRSLGRHRPDSIDALALVVFFTAMFLAVMAWTGRPAEFDGIIATRTPPTPPSTVTVAVHR